MWKTGLAVGLRALAFGTMICGTANAAGLQGSEWAPMRVADIPVPEESGAFVQFHSKGRLIGHGGCNRLFAEYHADDGQIFVGPVAATRMACVDELMTIEAEIAAALESARTYQRSGNSLVLFGSDGTPLMELRQSAWD